MQSLAPLIETSPNRYENTSSFGIDVVLSNGTYTIDFVRHKKGCLIMGNLDMSIGHLVGMGVKQQALNDYLWAIYTTETIKRDFLPTITLFDDTQYHKSKPNKERLAQWRFSDRHRGTTYESDYGNLPNHDLNHLVEHCDWETSIIAPPIEQTQSSRMNVLLSRISANERQQYPYITHITKLCQLASESIQNGLF
jgi:hypothetical protein